MNRIKELRVAKRLKQKELAQILQTNASSICSWEKGDYNPSAEQAVKLSKFFNCTVDYLMGFSEKDENLLTDNSNTITVYGRGTGKKVYKVSPKRLKAIQALLDEDDQSDDIDF